MALSTTIIKQEPDVPLTVDMLRQLLENCHGDMPVMIKIGDGFHNIREVRHVAGDTPGSSVRRVLVPVDFTLETK